MCFFIRQAQPQRPTACALVALRIALEIEPDQFVVCMIADGGERYVHTLFNDGWMKGPVFPYDAGIDDVRAMAQRLRPWSERPRDVANYQPDLINSLGVPESTLAVNAEIIREEAKMTKGVADMHHRQGASS
ncbi:MAG: hypothetical protein BLM47_12400 [Candidatus Reconcilbacillus cellulovorans]|uniref:Tryptophan synthase beta chain-like PALP domain-containing protein n=1 Tax=Candidatus Reconcilbacillus cellulovorans TaxID=1906605 RepID=A0A2A6DY49_9BACL|nr:MAG: hypothetical protein BLM47_12400 [Candidatus Reconcilbacillus cellulovorans]